MKKLFVCMTAVCVLTGAGAASAAGGDPSESGVPTSPLKIYSCGLAFGGFYPMSDSLKAAGDVFGKVVWLNAFDFTENFALSLDINWYFDKDFSSLTNFGVDAGGDYSFMSEERVSPFVGAGVGVHYFDRDTADALAGLSLTLRAGVSLKLTNTVDVKVRVPFHFILSEAKDMGIGVEVGAIFFSNLRRVKSVTY